MPVTLTRGRSPIMLAGRRTTVSIVTPARAPEPAVRFVMRRISRRIPILMRQAGVISIVTIAMMVPRLSNAVCVTRGGLPWPIIRIRMAVGGVKSIAPVAIPAHRIRRSVRSVMVVPCRRGIPIPTLQAGVPRTVRIVMRGRRRRDAGCVMRGLHQRRPIPTRIQPGGWTATVTPVTREHRRRTSVRCAILAGTTRRPIAMFGPIHTIA